MASERGIGLLSVRWKNYRLNDNERHWRPWAERRPHADIMTRSSVSDNSCEGPAWLGEDLGFEDEEMNLEGNRVVGRVGLNVVCYEFLGPSIQGVVLGLNKILRISLSLGGETIVTCSCRGGCHGWV